MVKQALRAIFIALVSFSPAVLSQADQPGSSAPVQDSKGPNPIILWREQRALRDHASAVWCVTFSPDGKRIATGTGGYLGDPGHLKIWNVADGREILSVLTQRSVRWVQFAPDGKSLATAEHEDQGAARIREASTGKVLHTLVGHSRSIDTLAFSPSGQQLATASWDKTVKIWSTRTGKEVRTLEGHPGEVYPVAFSPDGHRLLSGDGTGIAILWDADSGKKLHTLKGHAKVVQAVAFAPDGKTLATASWDKTVKLWKTRTGEELATLKGHTDPILDLAFSPDGKKLASVSGVWGNGDSLTAKAGANEVILWDLATRKKIIDLNGHTERIFGVAFSPDGRRLATASWDKTVKIWRGLRARAPAEALDARALASHWKHLAGEDFDKSADAVELLAGAPRQSMPFLRERLRAVKAADSEKRVAALLKQLDDDSFEVREKATKELEDLGALAGPQLQQALEEERSLEARKRIKRLLGSIKMPKPTSEQKRLLWAVTVLELAAAPEGHTLLEELVRGSAGAWLAQEARAALKRLEKRKE
jgi:Tol biopolymer transport system component